MDIQTVIEYLQKKGIEPEPKKSAFQTNEEMATMLLTLLMGENDFLRARVNDLERRVSALEGGADE